MEEKKENGKGIVIILLVLMVLALGSYIIYDKVLSKEEVVDTSKEKEEKMNIEVLETTSEQVKGLVGKITNNIACKNYRDIYFTDAVFKGENFSNADVFALALSSMYSEVVVQHENGTDYKDFTAERLEREIKKIVGKDYKFTHQTYSSCPKWNYDAKTKNYKGVDSKYNICGCTSGPGTISKTVKAIKNGDKIEIYQRVFFRDGATEKFYSDSNATKEIKNLRMDGYIQHGDILDSSDVSKRTLYKLVFEEENGEYIFISSSISE